MFWGNLGYNNLFCDYPAPILPDCGYPAQSPRISFTTPDGHRMKSIHESTEIVKSMEDFFIEQCQLRNFGATPSLPAFPRQRLH